VEEAETMTGKDMEEILVIAEVEAEAIVIMMDQEKDTDIIIKEVAMTISCLPISRNRLQSMQFIHLKY
jgi:hypothetical protein